MKLFHSLRLRHREHCQRRSLLGRVLRGTLYASLTLLLVTGIVAGLFYLRLKAEPLRFEGLTTRVSSALGERLGAGWSVTLKDASIQIIDGTPGLQAEGLDIRNPAGVLTLRAPQASVGIDPWSLLRFNPQPRSLLLRNLQVRASIGQDGSLFVQPPEEALPASAQAQENDTVSSQVSNAVNDMLDALLGSSVIGAMDRAQIVDARLTLTDIQHRDRVAFRRLDALFERKGRSRLFDARLDSPNGIWQVKGEAKGAIGALRGAQISFSDVPVQDALLLAGLSGSPARSDLKLSGQFSVGVKPDRSIESFNGKAVTRSGVIRFGDAAPPFSVDEAAGEAEWDESRHVLKIARLAYKSGATDVALSGQYALLPDQSWTVALAGRDISVSGANERDTPFKLETVSIAASGADATVQIDDIVLRGPHLGISFQGSYNTPDAPDGLKLGIRASQSDVRQVLRLWPDKVGPKARDYLIKNLRKGLMEELTLAVVLTPQNLVDVSQDKGLPDSAIRIGFSLTGGTLFFVDGMPPVSEARFEGMVTGKTALVRLSEGNVRMPDGRALAVPDGSLTIPDLWPDDIVAPIVMRLTGGGDALLSLLSSPLLNAVSASDLDPANVKGDVNLRVDVPLMINDVPKASEIPVSVTGTISNLVIDKSFGKEKLDNANLNVSFERGNLVMKGDSRVSGVPAILEIRQPRGGALDVSITLTLDEAARAKRGLSFGGQAPGPLTVKASLPLGKSAKAGTRIEADLSKLSIDNLLPGWTKPAGKPGKLSLTLGDNDRVLKDIVLESGGVLLKGSVTLGEDDALQSADIAALRLSPGDDMKAQVERSGGIYKVTVRGNVADARPFIKLLDAQGGDKKKDSDSFDVDASLNILTGYNDEALTNAVLKLSKRGKELRQFQLGGKFRSAPVKAQITRQGTTPLIVLQSENAGAALRFLDLYKRMEGGDLVLQATNGEARQSGSIVISDFVLRNEPALDRIFSQQPPPNPADKSSPASARINASDVAFTKMKVDFTRGGGRFDFRDAVIWGPQVGFKLSGFLDQPKNRTDITGTFVPAYGLNNIFSQVPLLGPILGGGSNEGLFAINFRIAGAANAPVLTIDPLSAVAPGIFRKLFGAITGGGQPAPPPPAAGE